MTRLDLSKQANIERIIRILGEGYDVYVEDLVPIVYDGQKNYVDNLTDEEITEAIYDVIGKTDVVNIIETAYFVDKMSKDKYNGKDIYMPTVLFEAQKDDAPFFGVDELMAEGIARLYNTIGLSNYYHLDKAKPGIIGEMNDRMFTVMMDDCVSAIAGSAMARVSSYKRNLENEV